eukprot:6192378-Pleurochrysis_carterae.AAC.1
MDRRGSEASAGAGGAPARRLGEGGSIGSGGHHKHDHPKAWGAERERFASTHATRVQFGKLCM